MHYTKDTENSYVGHNHILLSSLLLLVFLCISISISISISSGNNIIIVT